VSESGKAEQAEQGGQEEMPEPIIGTVLAKAIGAGADSASQKMATGLFARVLGPSADEIGEALRRYTAYKLRNVGRIVEDADAKSSANPVGGIVNARLAYILLEEGSLCDDELMANYLGGVLAGSRSPDGRDDRAIAWSRVITSLSSLQIKAHYLLYREWAARLRGVPINRMMNINLYKVRMNLELDEFLDALTSSTDVEREAALNHSIAGLARMGLINEKYWWVSHGKLDFIALGRPFKRTLSVQATPTGLELYGWAQGLPGVTQFDFPSMALPFDTEPPIPRLSRIKLGQRWA
jgi:hypothetical protein